MTTQLVDEPETHDGEFVTSPARPAGGPPPLPSSAPPMSPVVADDETPSSPQSRRTSLFKSNSTKRESVASIERTATRSSIDSNREQYLAGGFGAPQRSDSVHSQTASGRPSMDAPLPPLPEGGQSTSQLQSQSQYSPDQLASFSSTLGAQIFAAAHTKLSSRDKETDSDSFVDYCFSRATNPAQRNGHGFGAPVLDLEMEEKSKNKTPTVRVQIDEPRAGDGE